MYCSNAMSHWLNKKMKKQQLTGAPPRQALLARTGALGCEMRLAALPCGAGGHHIHHVIVV
jgi:hypothetical protein